MKTLEIDDDLSKVCFAEFSKKKTQDFETAGELFINQTILNRLASLKSTTYKEIIQMLRKLQKDFCGNDDSEDLKIAIQEIITFAGRK